MKGKILIVDDEKASLKSLKDILRLEGYSVTAKENGEDAIEALESDDNDLMLLDLNMPGMTGYETLEYLKQHPKTAAIPVVMVTAQSELEAVERCLSAGAVDYIQKPFELLQIEAKIEKILAG